MAQSSTGLRSKEDAKRTRGDQTWIMLHFPPEMFNPKQICLEAAPPDSHETSRHSFSKVFKVSSHFLQAEMVSSRICFIMRSGAFLKFHSGKFNTIIVSREDTIYIYRL